MHVRLYRNVSLLGMVGEDSVTCGKIKVILVMFFQLIVTLMKSLSKEFYKTKINVLP